MIAYLRCVVDYMNTKEGLKETAKLLVVPSLLIYFAFTGGQEQMRMISLYPQTFIVADTLLYVSVYFLMYTVVMIPHHILFYYFQAQDEKNSEQVS